MAYGNFPNSSLFLDVLNHKWQLSYVKKSNKGVYKRNYTRVVKTPVTTQRTCF